MSYNVSNSNMFDLTYQCPIYAKTDIMTKPKWTNCMTGIITLSIACIVFDVIEMSIFSCHRSMQFFDPLAPLPT